MKAVIVEIRGDLAAALTESGSFVYLVNEQYAIGQEVLISQKAPAKKRMPLGGYIGAVASLVFFVLAGWMGYTAPVGVVSLDVNPSIEYSINYFDQVLDIYAVNEDAKQILAGMDVAQLYHRPVEEAVDETILVLREKGYFPDGKTNDIVISASSYESGHTQELAQRLGERVQKQSDLSVYSVAVSKKDVKEAHEIGTSAGKLHIIELLGESWGSEDTFEANDWIGRPVKWILRETELREKANHLAEKGKEQQDETPGKKQENDKNENGADKDTKENGVPPEKEQGPNEPKEREDENQQERDK